MAQNIFLTLTVLMVFPSLLDCLTIKQLHDKYNEIFARTQNRNAASHLWVSRIFFPTIFKMLLRELFCRQHTSSRGLLR